MLFDRRRAALRIAFVVSAAVALAWLLAKSPTIRVIPGATSIEQLKANVGGAKIVLSSEEMAALDKLDKT